MSERSLMAAVCRLCLYVYRTHPTVIEKSARFIEIIDDCGLYLINNVVFFVCFAERSSNTFASETGALWLPFQTAAGTVTTLYKGESNDIARK